MYEVTATLVISASHRLRGYEGKCENVHGHNYKIEATVAAEELDGTGLAVDFKVLKEHLHKVAGKFDHSDLNQHDEFRQVNPSSENLARVVFSGLKASMQGLAVKVVRVSVWESEGSYVTYLE
jgi:6-pyruvoyltetrahydropterin/6-carboxytetrahydropterin synthase